MTTQTKPRSLKDEAEEAISDALSILDDAGADLRDGSSSGEWWVALSAARAVVCAIEGAAKLIAHEIRALNYARNE